jgi:hypothetical protein
LCRNLRKGFGQVGLAHGDQNQLRLGELCRGGGQRGPSNHGKDGMPELEQTAGEDTAHLADTDEDDWGFHRISGT